MLEKVLVPNREGGGIIRQEKGSVKKETLGGSGLVLKLI